MISNQVDVLECNVHCKTTIIINLLFDVYVLADAKLLLVVFRLLKTWHLG